MKYALSIAGSDPSGGAGLQADLKVLQLHGVYGAAAITLVTVQSSTRVHRVEPLDARLVREQIDAIDHPIAAAKVGALGTAAIVDEVAAFASTIVYPLIVDPVCVASSGAPLLEAEAIDRLRTRLIPRATLLTPNAPEASILCGREVIDRASAIDAARALVDLGARAVLVKGGHLGGDESVDVLLHEGVIHELRAPRSPGDKHGTGCALSAAICARMARGEDLVSAVSRSKAWLSRAIAAPGPLDPFTPPDI
jgi:hydroxymethylpyrimidine/phosphomethylpyrimidine kinase